MSYRPLSADQKQQLATMWASDQFAIWQIAQSLGVGCTTVQRKAKRLGLGPKASKRCAMAWPDGAETRLAALAAQGLSARECAKTMTAEYGRRLTRNAIIGKCGRLNIKLANAPPQGVRKRKLSKPRARPAPDAYRNHPWGTRDPETQPYPTSVPRTPKADAKRLAAELDAALRAAGDLPEPKLLISRSANECAWIVGEPNAGDQTRCCGAVIFKRSWCAHHWAVGRRPGTALTYDQLLANVSRPLKRAA